MALTSTNHARLYGLYPRKGTIAVGSDADFAIWDADKDVTIRWKNLHDNVGYTPYEGREIKGVADRRGEPRLRRRRERQAQRRTWLRPASPCESPDSSKLQRHDRLQMQAMSRPGRSRCS